MIARSRLCSGLEAVSIVTSIHFHILALDGVYAAAENGHPRFHALPAPDDAHVVEGARRKQSQLRFGATGTPAYCHLCLTHSV